MWNTIENKTEIIFPPVPWDWDQPGTTKNNPPWDWDQPGTTKNNPPWDWDQPGTTKSNPLWDWDQPETTKKHLRVPDIRDSLCDL